MIIKQIENDKAKLDKSSSSKTLIVFKIKHRTLHIVFLESVRKLQNGYKNSYNLQIYIK